MGVKSKIGTLFGFLLGVIGLGWLSVGVAWDTIFVALEAVGWGVAAVAGIRFLAIVIDAQSWRILVDSDHRPSFPFLVAARWIGESINTLLPVAQVGGDVVRARLLLAEQKRNHRPYSRNICSTTSASADSDVDSPSTSSNDEQVPGMHMSRPTGAAAAAVGIADFSIGLVGQAIFTLLCVFLLLTTTANENMLVPAVSGLALLIVSVFVFIFAQKNNLVGRIGTRVARSSMAANYAQTLSATLAATNDELAKRYATLEPLLVACLYKLLGWCLRVAEVWIVLRLIGYNISLVEAFVIEGISQAVRSMAFPIPGAIGAQEAGIIGTCAALGIDFEIAAALALVKRAREVLVCTPGLVAWWFLERRRK